MSQRKEKNNTRLEERARALTQAPSDAGEEEAREASKKAKKEKKQMMDARKAEEADRKQKVPSFYSLTFPGLKDGGKGGKD